MRILQKPLIKPLDRRAAVEGLKKFLLKNEVRDVLDRDVLGISLTAATELY
jgi:hypothetical protein